MYKVCFVDDETINHQLMEKLVDWSALGFAVAGTATDGFEALELYERVQPDIMFIDIKMPLMDGLECVRRIREKDSDVQLVLVTAFGEFSYAQKAICYHVNNYLLKPVDRAEMNSLVEKLRHQLDVRTQKDASVSDTEREHRRGRFALLLQQALAGARAGEQLSGSAYDPLFGEPLDVIDLEFFPLDGKAFVPEEGEGLKARVAGILVEHGIEVQATVSLACFRAVVLTGVNSGSKDEALREIIELGLKLDFGTDIYTPHEPLSRQDWAGVLRTVGSDDRLGFYQSRSHVYNCQEAAYYGDEAMSRQGLDGTIRLAFEQMDVGILREYIDAQIEDAKQRRVRPSALRDFCVDLLASLKLQLKDYFPFDTFAVLRSIGLDELMDTQKSAQLRRVLSAYLENMFLELAEQLRHSSREQLIVMKAKAFATENFGSVGFSLQAVANHVGISKNYFVKIYKGTTGIGFWEYITALRMDRAKELLKTTDDTLATISRQVGYESEYHFLRKFKDLMGKTPNQYRRG